MTFDLKCKKHTRYQAKRAPRNECAPCWIMYHLKLSSAYIFNITEKGYTGTIVVQK